MLQLAESAGRERVSLTELVAARGAGEPVDLSQLELLAPIDHPDPAHLMVSGTGLTHVGSALERDRMHRSLSDRRSSRIP